MIKPGLQRISRLLAQTPLPWPAIHVAGTNGKGSICAYISAMLDVYNKSSYLQKTSLPKLRHGRFTSPHLIDRWDCISIDGAPVQGDAFKAVEAEVLQRDREYSIGASEFEVLTATAFEIFNREKVDIGVVEVGMGGAEDATNVIGQPLEDASTGGNEDVITRKLPLVTVISKIGMDHQSFLGNTLQEIAKQKAGIFKPGVPIIFDPANAPEVQDVIRSVATEKGCPLYERHDKFSLYKTLDDDFENRQIWEYLFGSISRTFGKDNRPPPHVIHNATLALMAVNTALVRLGRFSPEQWPLNKSAPSDGHKNHALFKELKNLRNRMMKVGPKMVFPGRQQWLQLKPIVGVKKIALLDGAHNADSALALADKVNMLRKWVRMRPVTWVFAASDTKDAKEISRPLFRPGDRAVLVEFGPVGGMPWVRPMPVQKLEEALHDLAQEAEGVVSAFDVVHAGDDVLYALKEAARLSRDKAVRGPLVIAGSLYLVGDVLRLLRDAQSGSAQSSEAGDSFSMLPSILMGNEGGNIEVNRDHNDSSNEMLAEDDNESGDDVTGDISSDD